jgi:rubrerythrin
MLLGGINDTLTNLKEAMGGEDYEVENMYPQFAKEAQEEGQTEAAIAFEQVAKIEAHHRARYQKLIDMVEAGTVYKRDQPIKWKCSICGYIVEGNEPPPKCPSCKHPKEFYEPANMDF